MTVLIGVGANLLGCNGRLPEQSCEAASRCVAAIPGVTGVVRSRWFSSAPIPPSAQPRYVNGVLCVATGAAFGLSPAQLLSRLQAIECDAGRVPGARNAARALDLDLLDMDGRSYVGPDLVLPHPRAHLRAFVLLPLRDVVPEWRHPQFGPLAGLIAALPDQDIFAL